MPVKPSLRVVLLVASGCSSSPTSPPPADAGSDPLAVDAGHPETGAPPPDSGAPADGGGPCDHLKELVDQASALARSCDQRAAAPCSAAVDGLCCPVTVDAANNAAVNDFQQAVKNYKARCMPNCTKILCGVSPPPSNQCDTSGACR